MKHHLKAGVGYEVQEILLWAPWWYPQASICQWPFPIDLQLPFGGTISRGLKQTLEREFASYPKSIMNRMEPQTPVAITIYYR